MNICFFLFSSWTKILSGQDFSDTVSAVNMEANERMNISTALCKGICSSFLPVKSVGQTLLKLYKFTFSNGPASATSLSRPQNEVWLRLKSTLLWGPTNLVYS